MSTDLSATLSATLPASAKVPPRPSLTVMLVLHAVFTALRAIFSREAGEATATRLDELIALGHLTVARAFLAPYADEPLSAHPDRVVTAVEAASRALVAAIDAAMMTAQMARGRRFYARVSLMGRQDLGVCLVVEERLGGSDMLLMEQLEHEGRPCHWVRASSCYQIAEMTESAAMKAAVAADERRREQQARDLKRTREEALRVELAKIERAKGPVIFRTVPDSDRVIVFAHAVGALESSQADVAAMLDSLGFDDWQIRDYRVGEGRLAGFWVYDGDRERRDALFEALKGLGFPSVEQEVAKRDDEPTVDSDDETEAF